MDSMIRVQSISRIDYETLLVNDELHLCYSLKGNVVQTCYHHYHSLSEFLVSGNSFFLTNHPCKV